MRSRPSLCAAAAGAALMSACSGGSDHSSTPQPSAPAPSQPAASAVPATLPPTTACPASGTPVRTAAELTAALASARPGGVILLLPGRYAGHFDAKTSGTAAAPITLCGPPSAVLDGGNPASGYALHLDGASWWHVVGISLTDAQKGLVADHASNDLLSDLQVHDIGDEGIHLRAFSSNDVVERSVVTRTGLRTAKFGEGIYVGSARKNWCTFSGCGPDASDHDVIRANVISDTTAENIDIKEGTTGGIIEGNRLSGTGMVESAATAWVNIKGNAWMIADNTGQTSIRDGFQTHRILSGWGMDNVFTRNTARVDGPGYGFYVQSESLRAHIACDNVAIGAAAGLSNRGCE